MLFRSVYIFNSGLIVPSLLIYGYILLLGLTFKTEDFSFFKTKQLPISVLTILEFISIAFYIYLLTLDGDLFFGTNPETGYSESIRNSNLPYGSLIALHLILLVVPIFFRFVKLHKFSLGFYILWMGFEIWFLHDIYIRYILNGYNVTDGIFYFFPPILIGLYGLVIGGNKIRIKVENKT